MISLSELNAHGFPTTPEIDANLATLLTRINKVRVAWGKPMTVTTGFRTWADHVRIYRDIAVKMKKLFDESKVPKGSKHLSGQAVDIADPIGQLYSWLKANPQVLTDAGLWCEERMGGWVHFQTVPPKSGNLWFFP